MKQEEERGPTELVNMKTEDENDLGEEVKKLMKYIIIL